MNEHARLEDRFIPEPNTGCWLWTSTVTRKGYGIFHVSGRKQKAHRVSWKLYVGPIPDGLCVLHRCDTPSCVNPAHLFLGTHADNVADMDKKGRRNAARGEANGHAKLSAADVLDILESGSVMGITLAQKYNVSSSLISQIRSGNKWRCLVQRVAPAGS